jgi:hypothetical protein
VLKSLCIALPKAKEATDPLSILEEAVPVANVSKKTAEVQIPKLVSFGDDLCGLVSIELENILSYSSKTVSGSLIRVAYVVFV